MTIDLNVLYDQLNREFFDGGLLRYQVKLVARVPGKFSSGACYSKRQLIILSRGLERAPRLRETLLHEMCHVGTSGKHDRSFQAKLKKLERRGETWAGREWREYAEDTLLGEKQTMKQKVILSALDDLIEAHPDWSWMMMRQGLADHLCMSVMQLLQAVPDLRQIWEIRKAVETLDAASDGMERDNAMPRTA